MPKPGKPCCTENEIPTLPARQSDNSRIQDVAELERRMIASESATSGREFDPALSRNEEYLRAIIEAGGGWTWELDRNNLYSFVGAATKTLVGYEPDQMIGRPCTEFLRASDAVATLAVLEKFRTERRPFASIEVTMISRSGQEVICESGGTPIFDGEGSFSGFKGFSRDITRIKRDQAELEKSYALLRTIGRIGAIGGWDWDVAQDRLVWSEEVYRIFGRDPSDWAPTIPNFLACIHPDDRPGVNNAIEATLIGKEPYDVDFRILRPDGLERIVNSRAELTLDKAGRVAAMTGAVFDITDRRRAEIQVREDESKFQNLVEQSLAGIIILRENGTIAYVNSCMASMIGYKPEEMIGRHILDFIWESGKDSAIQNIGKHMSGGLDVIRVESPFRARNGQRVDVLLQAGLTMYEGRPASIALLLDITERKRWEQTVRASEERFRLLVENAPDAILLFDADLDRFVDANGEAERLFGCGREEIVKHGPAHFYAPEQPDGRPVSESVADHGRQALAGERLVYERRIRRSTGEDRICQVTMVGLPSERGRLLRGSMVDITERKESEQKIARLNRALVTLSRGNIAVVHSKDETELLDAMCRIIVEAGGYRMAWIGKVQRDATKSVQLVARAGSGSEHVVERLSLSWDDVPEGRGPTGRAIRSGEPSVSQNILADPTMAPWVNLAREFGIASSVTLPVKNADAVFAILLIYAAEPNAFDPAELKLLRELADDLAFGINALREHEKNAGLEQRWRSSLETTVGAIANTIEMRDPYTAGHQQHVGRLAAAIARRLGLSEHRIRGIHLAGIIHDVGKINVPAEILNKPGKLSSIELEMIHEHAEAGYRIVKDIDFPWPIAQIVRQHHERLDGSGYPQGLRGDEILAEAKILSVADVVDAITSHRPYRAALGIEAALAEITEKKGVLFDSDAVEACISVFREGFSFDAQDSAG